MTRSAASPMWVLTFSCPNRPGIVAKVAQFIFDQGGNILESAQFDDVESNQFFMRVAFNPVTAPPSTAALAQKFSALAQTFSMRWELTDLTVKPRVMVLVSKFDHCLVDLLYRQRIGELDMDIAAIVSNHPKQVITSFDLGDIPFYHAPVTAETRPQQEQKLLDIAQQHRASLIVLARYMQVLSPALCERLQGRAINIHHSFLPSFKGAKPYHQAFARGVKLIGATAHYVTQDLDDGPIIDQAIERVSHADGVDALIRKGRDIERRVLASAVRLHLERRVLINGRKTVVFA